LNFKKPVLERGGGYFKNFKQAGSSVNFSGVGARKQSQYSLRGVKFQTKIKCLKFFIVVLLEVLYLGAV
jgi:hypothetical protein